MVPTPGLSRRSPAPPFGAGAKNKAQGGACAALGQPIIPTQTSPARFLGAGGRIFSQTYYQPSCVVCMSHSYGLLYHISFCNQRRKAINAPAALGAHPSVFRPVFGRLARGLGQRSAGWRRGQSYQQIKQNSLKLPAFCRPPKKRGGLIGRKKWSSPRATQASPWALFFRPAKKRPGWSASKVRENAEAPVSALRRPGHWTFVETARWAVSCRNLFTRCRRRPTGASLQ